MDTTNNNTNENFQTNHPTHDITEACVVLLKWDAIQLSKDRNFDIVTTTTEWLKSYDLKVLAVHAIFRLTGEQIDTIYVNIKDKPFYQSMRLSLENSPAVAMLIGGSDDVHGRMKMLKGNADTEGTIRWHWSFKRELEKTHEFDDWVNHRGKFADEKVWNDIQAQIYRDDRIHSSDSTEDTRNNCKALFPVEMLQDVLKKYPALANTIGHY
ncbi:MAG TPA: nucleoside-diphosphate kinase [Candidatus Saccharimonadales bacterium]|nr:nucleoside-diphosphate kinase [Candidatus Saccharimonadales bacterium]